MHWMTDRPGFQTRFQSGTQWDLQFRKPVDSLSQKIDGIHVAKGLQDGAQSVDPCLYILAQWVDVGRYTRPGASECQSWVGWLSLYDWVKSRVDSV